MGKELGRPTLHARPSRKGEDRIFASTVNNTQGQCVKPTADVATSTMRDSLPEPTRKQTGKHNYIAGGRRTKRTRTETHGSPRTDVPYALSQAQHMHQPTQERTHMHAPGLARAATVLHNAQSQACKRAHNHSFAHTHTLTHRVPARMHARTRAQTT